MQNFPFASLLMLPKWICHQKKIKEVIISILSLRLILLMEMLCDVNHADHIDRKHYFEKWNCITQSNLLAIIICITATVQPALDASCFTFHVWVAGNTKKFLIRTSFGVNTKGMQQVVEKFCWRWKKHLMYKEGKKQQN